MEKRHMQKQQILNLVDFFGNQIRKDINTHTHTRKCGTQRRQALPTRSPRIVAPPHTHSEQSQITEDSEALFQCLNATIKFRNMTQKTCSPSHSYFWRPTQIRWNVRNIVWVAQANTGMNLPLLALRAISCFTLWLPIALERQCT